MNLLDLAYESIKNRMELLKIDELGHWRLEYYASDNQEVYGIVAIFDGEVHYLYLTRHEEQLLQFAANLRLLAKLQSKMTGEGTF